jgi:hypothetical protein
MKTATILLTRRHWNPVSALIRWSMPRSRFAWALSSHAIVQVDQQCYEATMLYGVRRVECDVALAGQHVVRAITVPVPDLAAGIAWAEAQRCRYTPVAPTWLPIGLQRAYCAVALILQSNYDWRGAFGLSLAPDRNWADEDCWFCYEFAAAFLRACGIELFKSLPHVGETALLTLER